MAIAPIPMPLDRRLTDQARIDECRIELAVHKAEEITFIRRVRGDANRVIRLIEGGLLAEAHSTLGSLVHVSNRREAQVVAPDDGSAA